VERRKLTRALRPFLIPADHAEGFSETSASRIMGTSYLAAKLGEVLAGAADACQGDGRASSNSQNLFSLSTQSSVNENGSSGLIRAL